MWKCGRGQGDRQIIDVMKISNKALMVIDVTRITNKSDKIYDIT